MPRYVAFLRAINVGGRVVRMERLREVFAAQGFSDVETFIASGNVIFTAPGRAGAALEKKIEAVLEPALGYPVAAFVRPVSELDGIAARDPFAGDAVNGTVHVGFLRTEPTPAARRALIALRTDVDDLDVAGRELYWRIRGAFVDSKLRPGALERTLGPTTMRNRNTIARLAKKYAAR